MDIKKTANLFANFIIKRIAEIFGITIFGAGVLLLLALLTYSPEDPNFIFPENTKIENILGFQGSFVSDVFFQSIGLVSYFFSFTLIITGINIIRSKEFFLIAAPYLHNRGTVFKIESDIFFYFKKSLEESKVTFDHANFNINSNNLLIKYHS